MTKEHYTFGDNDAASERLRRLAEIYEPETRGLLERSGAREPKLAVDLGCGPGWSTRLVREVLRPQRTIGLDASERYVAEARENHGTELEFAVHDITRSPFPMAAPNVLFCRFVLTHVKSIPETLATWASVAAPGALLMVHETESLNTEDASLRRYNELVERLQAHYGQALHAGALLEASFKDSGWRLVENKRQMLEKPAKGMAELHVANLRTWRNDPYAREAFDGGEIDRLERSIAGIAEGTEEMGIVVNAARQVIAVRE